jgi:hypothetical protein
LLDTEQDYQNRQKNKYKQRVKEKEVKPTSAGFVFTRNVTGNLEYIHDKNDPTGAILSLLLTNSTMTARVVNGFNAIGLRNSEPRKRVGSEYIELEV